MYFRVDRIDRSSFHAGDAGSNPAGDARKILGLSNALFAIVTIRSRFPISRRLKMTDQTLSGDVIGHFRWRSVHEELVEQARDVVNGLSTDELRQDGNLRKYIVDEVNHLRIQVDGALEDLPQRKIRLAA